VHYVLRYVFHAVGIVLLAYIVTVSPAFANITQVLHLAQESETWRDVGLLAMMLAAFDFTLCVSSLGPAIAPRGHARKGESTAQDVARNDELSQS
jgi:hypothetical protein